MQIQFLTARNLVDMLGYALPSGGDIYGYQTASSLAKQSLIKAGVEFSSDSEICFQYTPPHWFKAFDNKINVLFSMWEAEDIPSDLLTSFAKADYVIAPSRNTKEAIRRGNVFTPVYICPQACDTEFYYYTNRKLSGFGGVVRFLWVGAPNIRKGYDLAIQAFYDAFHHTDAKVEFYVKSTLEGKEGKITPLPKFDAVVDTRDFTREELRELYWSAQVFLYPSRGEGAGLPLLEAMSTGLPVIAPPYSGMRDYMLPEHSYPVKWTLIECEYGVKTKVCESDPVGLVDTLRKVYNNLPQALIKGKKASDFVEKYFSVEAMGFNLVKILEDIKKRGKHATR